MISYIHIIKKYISLSQQKNFFSILKLFKFQLKAFCMVQNKSQIILIISFIRHYFRILNQEKLNKYPTNLADD